MSMPGKGNKHHHLPHHHQQHHPQQAHQQQLHQAQHVVNVNQTGVTHSPQAYNTVVAASQQRFVPHGGSEFHVPGQSYGAQPGGQVGGGGGNVGVPGGRGPPLGIQTIQSSTGIPQGGPTAGQQAPPQAPTPQPQQPQGPTPTTTPPVHTPSPQEMGKQGHLQALFVPNQHRPSSQGYYSGGPRPQQPRGMNHRGGQGGGSAQVISMTGVPGAGAQQIQYSHPNLPGMFVQNQVSGIHQQPVNYQMSMQYRPQPHQNQGQGPYYQYHQHPTATILTPSAFYFPHAPQQLYPVNPAFIRTASASTVNSNPQHMQGQLTNAQGNTVVPQGSLQQPAQQSQQMQTMMSVTSPEVFSGHNGGASSASSASSRKSRRSKAVDIIDPETGKNISDELYNNDQAKGDIDNREAPQMQNCDKAVIADFAAMVAKAATESSSDSPVASSAPESPSPQNVSQSLSNLKVQTNSSTNSQSNTGPPTPTQNLSGAFTPNSQSLGTSSNAAQLESCPVKVDSKPLQPSIKEFQPRGIDVKMSPVTDQFHVPANLPAPVTNKDNKIPTQPPAVSVPAPEVDLKNASLPQTPSQTPIPSSTPSSIIPDVHVPSATAVNANIPVPAKDPFPNLVNKNKSSSPPRRKYQNQNVPSNAITIPEMPPLIKESKEQKERKANEKNAVTSRGATPTPAHNQTEHIHQKTNGETGDKSETETLPKNETQQKTSEGKAAMQKQKTKSKQKNRDISRKGAEKEGGSDMDAFVNLLPTGKIEPKQTEIKDSTSQRDSNKEPIKEITKDIKEKDNHESKKEKQVLTQSHEKLTTPEISTENTPIIEKTPPASFNHKDSKSIIEESSKAPVVSNMTPIPNDVVDHSMTIKTEVDLKLIVAQKNEENSKVSALRASIEETVTVIEKQDENAAPNQMDTIPKLKYQYKDDQWSPLNQKGKKIYGREFLMKLQDDEKSKIKPLNLPDLDVVLKDNSKIRQHSSRNRSPEMRSFKDHNMRGHDNLLPGFVKNSMNVKMGGGLPPANKKSNPGKPRQPNKPNMVIPISLSLREEVKLRESENAWKPMRLKSQDIDEEQAKTDALHKSVRSVLNKLTPQKFEALVNQVKALEIDTKERMEGVIKLVFEKAVDEPSFSVEYALMCKHLALMNVSGVDPSDTNTSNFRKLIITRCQQEFEKESDNAKLRDTKYKEIEECADPDKKKELLSVYQEEERRIRMKSVGNIRFIGELFMQGMLTKKIMHFCINHLLQNRDEENLECLCKLLTTVGKNLEDNNNDLKEYFKQMQSLANNKGPGKISSRVRFMLKDVIDLRTNNWVPRRDDSKPKTMDEIQKQAETERLDAQLNIPLNTPRKDDRNVDRRRNRGMGGSSEDGGWSQPVRTRASYTCDTSKLKAKPPSMDDLQLGNRSNYMWNKNVPHAGGIKTPNKFAALENMSSFEEKRPSLQLSGSRSTGPREYGRSDYKASYEGRSSRNGSQQLSSGSSSRECSVLDNARSQSISMPPQSKPAAQPTSISNKPEKSEDEIITIVSAFVEEYLAEGNMDDVLLEIKDNFPASQLPIVIREMINAVLEKSCEALQPMSKLFSSLISHKVITVNDFRKGLNEILDIIDDLIIDIPKIWSCVADILVHPLIDGSHPISELPITLAKLRFKRQNGKFVGELLCKMAEICGPGTLADKWNQSRLQLGDIINGDNESIDEIIKNYKLQFLFQDCKDKSSVNKQAPINFAHVQDHLIKLMKASNSFDEICSWLTNNVGDRVNDPQFVRVLMTAILEVSTVCNNQRHEFKEDIFQNFHKLIQRFVDTKEILELQCLFAAQAFANKLLFPSGLLLSIFDKLCDANIISYESFLNWELNDLAAEREGKAVALKALTSFFTSLKEAEEGSEEESMPNQVRQYS